MPVNECSICGCELGGPLGGPAHAQKHKNTFEEIVGRRPENYREVQALLNDGEVPDDVDGDLEIGERATLEQFVDGRATMTPLQHALVTIAIGAVMLGAAVATGVVL